MSGTVPADTVVVPLGEPGRRGVQGATGPLGPAGVRPEPTGGGIQGRQVQPAPARWTPALPLTGGALSGGLDMGAEAVPGLFLWPYSNDPRVTRHIDLWGGAFGLAVMSAAGVFGQHRANVHQFWENGNPTFSLRNNGEVWFSQDGWRLSWTWAAVGTNITGTSIYYNPANTPLFGEFSSPTDVDMSGYPDRSTRLVVWGDFYCVHEASSNARGVCFYNIIAPTRFLYIYGNGWIQGMVDRAVTVLLANACDERLKQNISPSQYDCLGAIRSVPLYQFRWQDNRLPREPRPAPRAAPVQPIGFVAQRLAERTPDLVAKPRPPPRLSPAEEDPPQAMWSVETNHMLAALVGAVQQLDQKLTALEDRRHA